MGKSVTGDRPAKTKGKEMAHLKTAIKRLQTSKKANLRNRARTSELKTYEKKFRAAVAEGNKEAAAEFLKITRSKLDKAAKVGTLHPNKVSNKKSQLDKLMNTMA